MKNLRLPLKRKWFEMTKKGIKKEDYREINPRYMSRFLLFQGDKMSQRFWDSTFTPNVSLKTSLKIFEEDISFVDFGCNIMTLGYPKSNDSERIIKLKHKGIEIQEGNPEWGAEPGKLYFVIKHGEEC